MKCFNSKCKHYVSDHDGCAHRCEFRVSFRQELEGLDERMAKWPAHLKQLWKGWAK